MMRIAVVAFFAIFAHAITGDDNAELQKHVRSTYVAPTANGARYDSAIAGQIATVPSGASVTSMSREVTKVNGGQAHAASASTRRRSSRATRSSGSTARTRSCRPSALTTR